MSLADQVAAVVAAIGAELKVKADAADLAAIATSGDYGDLSGTPTLGTAAATDAGAYATAAQGAKADSAVQPGDLTAIQSELDTKLDQAAVDARVGVGTAALVDQAPSTLDTLNELAAALGDDPNFATTVANQIGTKADAARKVNGHALTADVTVSKADVGLGNVDNTADAAKSVASAVTSQRWETPVAFQVRLDQHGTALFDGSGTVRPTCTGTLDVAHGGTGATTAAAARENIGAGTSNLAIGTTGSTACAGNDARLSDARTPTAHTHSATDITSGTLPLARGGTGATSAAAARTSLGAADASLMPVQMTQAQYNALGSGRPARLYAIVG